MKGIRLRLILRVRIVNPTRKAMKINYLFSPFEKKLFLIKLLANICIVELYFNIINSIYVIIVYLVVCNEVA